MEYERKIAELLKKWIKVDILGMDRNEVAKIIFEILEDYYNHE